MENKECRCAGNHSLCASDSQKLHEKDVTNLCQNWRRSYEQHIRPNHNEWLIEDMAHEVDQLNVLLYRQWKAGIICQKAYQDCMAIAWEQWSALILDCRNAEKETPDP